MWFLQLQLAKTVVKTAGMKVNDRQTRRMTKQMVVPQSHP